MFGDNNQDQPTNDAAQTTQPVEPSSSTSDIPSLASEPANHDEPSVLAGTSVDQPDTSLPSPTAPVVDTAQPDTTSSAPTTTPTDGDNLLDIKQQALSQLTPIVSHLDQTPDEKFKTLMMMIQASDDRSLIRSAYEAAQNITDEKDKARALLDVVNEINYFNNQDKK